MNLKNLFVSRDKNFARITEAGDYLGRRLRENLVIFDIDDSKNSVTYVTESGNLVSCDYKEVKGRLTLENFVVEDLEQITSDKAIDDRVEADVHSFMESLMVSRYDAAEVNFDKIVESFSMRAQINNSRKKLSKRLDRFNESYNIFNTKAYKKFQEAVPLLKKFLEENVDTLSQNAKLVEGLRLSKVVGDTYDLPKLEIKNLKEEFVVVPSNSKRTLYEMVCDKELVRKELLEAKESFSKMWHHNDSIASLAAHIYSTDSVIKTSLEEAIAAVPYLALSNKVDLTSVMDASFQVSHPNTIAQKDVREFVNKIYEFKKPLKVMVLEALNSKYGVNVQSLRFIPSFKGLAEVQSEVLGMIAESCEEGILSDVLKEFAGCMSRKGGVQVLDISNTLSKVMSESNFHIVDIDEDFHMKKLSDYLTHNLGEAQYYGDDDAMSNSNGAAGGGEKDDSEDVKEGDDDKKKAKKKKGKKVLSKKQKEMDVDDDGDIDTKDLKNLRKEGVEVAEETEDTEDGDVVEPSEEETDAQADEEMAAGTEDSANNTEWRDLVSSLEDVTKKIDLNFDAETEEDDEANAEAGEGDEPIPGQDSPA
tara:strand:- start:1299 stop:3068 length:1770 start_codon:yes stop_codon:yes gene_type:complete